MGKERILILYNANKCKFDLMKFWKLITIMQTLSIYFICKSIYKNFCRNNFKMFLSFVKYILVLNVIFLYFKNIYFINVIHFIVLVDYLQCKYEQKDISQFAVSVHVCHSVCISTWLSACLSVCPSVFPPDCSHICPSVCLFSICLSICLSVRLSVCLSFVNESLDQFLLK